MKFYSKIFSAEQEVYGHVEDIGNLYESFQRRFAASVLVADIGGLRDPQLFRHLFLSQFFQFSLFQQTLSKN